MEEELSLRDGNIMSSCLVVSATVTYIIADRR